MLKIQKKIRMVTRLNELGNINHIFRLFLIQIQKILLSPVTNDPIKGIIKKPKQILLWFFLLYG